MKSIILLLCISLQLTAGVYSQKTEISVNMQNVSIKEVLTELSNKCGYDFFYNDKDVSNVKGINVKFENTALEIILKKCLKGTNLTYRLTGNVVLILKKEQKDIVQKKKVKVTGKVVDDKGNAIPGATVLLKGTSVGVATDIDGKFTIEVPSSKDIRFVISFVGMKNQEIEYKGQKNIDVVLKAEASEIDEVVVTGYFKRKKDSYTGATTTFKGEELRQITTGNVLSALSAIDPSFTMVVNNEMGSDPNSRPEFVIRGAGSLKSDYEGNPNAPTFIMDGFEVSADKVYDLDPNRVRSITILKDAAATAIYGSRAANGVVVIETKIPKTGDLRVSYRGSMNFEVADLSDYDLMNAEEKFQFEQNCKLYEPIHDRPKRDEDKLIEFNNIQKLVARGIDTDWMSIPVKDVGIGQKHSFTFEGGDSKFRYSFDVSYSNKVGVMKESGRKGTGIGIRLQYNYRKFKFMNYLSYDKVKAKNSPYGDYSQYSYLNPYYYPYNEDGSISKELYKYTYYDRGQTTKHMYNGLYNTTLPVKDESSYNDFINNFSVEYNIVEGLRLKSQISINSKQTVIDKYLPKEHTDFIGKEFKGSYTQSHRDLNSYDFNTVLSYTKSFSKHQMNTAFVFNMSEQKNDGSTTKAVNFPNQHLDHIGMGTGYLEGSKPTGFYTITRLMGVVGNFNYNYDNRYLFDASVRNDASSLFGSDKRWGTFGSVGLGWNIHNEAFLKDNDLFEVLKLRGSWGLTGGQKFYAYQAMAMLSYNDSSINGISYDDKTGAILKALGNTNLKWQRIEKRNIGIDFETKNKRITGYLNFYSDISKDVLLDVTIAPSTGFNSYKENLGEVKNSGIEFNIRASIIKNLESKVQWDVFANVVRNKNKLMSINNALEEFNTNQDNLVNGGENRSDRNRPKIRYMQGKSINTIWANESAGIDPVTGKEIFFDMNNNLTDEWSSDNYKPLGNRDPEFQGNFGTRLLYKGVELNAIFAYSYGGDIYNQTLVDKVENIDPHENGDRRILTDRWQKPGDVAQFVGYNPMNPTITRPTSRFIEEENYIQLRSLSLAYQFSSQQLEKIGIERLKLSAIGNDIFRLSTVEMERGTRYPFARTYSLSVQLTF